MDGGSSATLYLGGKVINSPSTLSHEDALFTERLGGNSKPKTKIKDDN